MNLADLSFLKQSIKRCKREDRDYYYETGLPFPILSRKDINNIYTNLVLIEKNSFKVVSNSMYENYSMDNDPLNEINRIQKAFSDGNTVVAKNLETYNLHLDLVCRTIGNNVDVHMYSSPKDASGFPLHSDDRSVFIFMQYGEKEFFVKDEVVLLQPGDMLYIKQGVEHKAKATQASCHLSFGLAEHYLCDYATSLPLDVHLPF
jgi:ribosomal protein L16 Arg81 hydroxylase